MNAFENALLNGLPLADAAAFHVQLLGYDRPKLATAGGMAAPTLPPTANGQQMPTPAPVTLPSTAMGQNTVKAATAGTGVDMPAHKAYPRAAGVGAIIGGVAGAPMGMPVVGALIGSAALTAAALVDRTVLYDFNKKHAASDKTPEEVGKERARASLSAEKEKAEAHKREHGGGLVGSITGAALGGYASHRYGKGNPLATIAGAAVGHHIAGKTGREVGAVMDRHAKTASVKEAISPQYVASKLKGKSPHALREFARRVESSLPETPGDVGRWRHMDTRRPSDVKRVGSAQMARAEADFADRAARYKLGAAMKRAFEEVQNAGMGMGPGSPVDPQQAAQALDQPPAKPTPVTPAVDQATQQYLATQQELNQATDASAVQFYQEQLAQAKEQLEAAQQEAQQLQQSQAMHEQELAQIQTQVADSTQKAMMASDQVLKEQQGAAAMRMAYQQLRGQILNTVSSDPPSMSPDQAAMSAASTGAAPSSAPSPTSGPAGQAPAPGTPPGSPAPEGDATVPNADGIAMSKPMMDTAQPAVATGQKEQTGDAKTPQKEVLAAAVSKMTKAVGALKKHGPGAAAGAALGAATGHYETKRDVSHVKAVEKDLEGKKDRSFSESRRLGAAKAELATDDYAKKNPGKFTAMSAAAGGVAGGVLGPKMKDNIVKVREHVQSLRAAQAAAKKK